MLKPIIWGLIAGVAGVALMLAAVHLWTDHALLHTLVTIEQQREAAAAKAH